MFGPVSGGHFNPVVSFVDAFFGGPSWRDAAAYLPAQVARVHRRSCDREPDVRPPRGHQDGKPRVALGRLGNFSTYPLRHMSRVWPGVML